MSIDLQENPTIEKKKWQLPKFTLLAVKSIYGSFEKSIFTLFKSGNVLQVQVLDPPIDNCSTDYKIDVPILKTTLQTLFLKSSVLEK